MREHEQEVSKPGAPAKNRTGRKRNARRKSGAKSAAKRGISRKKTLTKTVSTEVNARADSENMQVRNDQSDDSNHTLPPAPDPFDQTAAREIAIANVTPEFYEQPQSPPYGFGSEGFGVPADATEHHSATVYQFEPAQQAPLQQARNDEVAASEPSQPEMPPEEETESSEPMTETETPPVDADVPPPPSVATAPGAVNDDGAAAPGISGDSRPLAPGIRLARLAGQESPPAPRPQPSVMPPAIAAEERPASDMKTQRPAAETAASGDTPSSTAKPWTVSRGLRLPSTPDPDPKWSRPARQAVSDMLQSSARRGDIDTQSGPRLPAEPGQGRTPFVLIAITGLVMAGFGGAMYWQFAGGDEPLRSATVAPPSAPVVESQAPTALAGSQSAMAEPQLQPSPQPQSTAVQPPPPPAAAIAHPVTPPAPALAKPLAPPVAANRSPAAPLAPAPATQAELRAVDVAGVAGEPLAIAIAVGPAELSDVLAVRVTGLPDEVSLSAGRPAENGSWLLSSADLRDLTLSAPGSLFGTFKLGLSLLRTDGAPHPDVKTTIDVEIAEAPARRTVTVAAASEAKQAPMTRVEVPLPAPLRPAGVAERQAPALRHVTVLQPSVVPDEASAPSQGSDAVAVAPPATPVAPPAAVRPPQRTAPAGQNFSALIARGDALIKEGDIASARLIFEHGANAGNVEAAMRLAEACDPLVISKLDVYGVQPDSKCALKWYRFAAENGDREAVDRLEKLKSWLAGVDRFSAYRN